MTSLSPDDYDAIESAVMETARGRWFLAEYARRNRHADTEMLLDAIERLARVGAPAQDRAVAVEPAALAATIGETKAEIAALAPDDTADDAFDLVASGAERAVVEVMASERIQDAAWTAREQGFDPDQCDALDAGAAAIYAALAHKELAAQRIRKAVALLHRIEAMIDAPAMMDDIGAPEFAAADLPDVISAVALALNDEDDQAPVEDDLLADAEPETNDVSFGTQPILIDPETIDAPLAASAAELEQDGFPPLDPLAAVRAMSERERMQLFS